MVGCQQNKKQQHNINRCCISELIALHTRYQHPIRRYCDAIIPTCASNAEYRSSELKFHDVKDMKESIRLGS
jgi:hypothetical protein